MTDLKLIALDDEDIKVLSAHLQDAVVRVADMAYLPRERRFAALLNRFDWESALKGSGTNRRRRTAIRFERVLAAKLQGIDLKDKARVLVLLAITCEAAEAPAAQVTLVFAGGAAIRLDVECVEAELKDLGGQWRARAKPEHSGGSASKEPASEEAVKKSKT